MFPPRLPQGLAHLLHVRHVVGEPVVFQIVESPERPLAGVVGGKRVLPEPLVLLTGQLLRPGDGRIVARSAGELGIGRNPGGRVDARLQADPVDLVAESFHVGEFLVRLEAVQRAAAPALPGVVDVDVRPAVIDQAGIDHRVGRTEDLVLIDGGRPAVPTVPAQRRGEADLLADNNAKRLLGRAGGVLGPQHYLVFAGLFHHSADLTRGRSDGQPRGQSVDAELHGPLPGGGNGIEERRAGPGAEEGRPVDPRFGGRRRREDLGRLGRRQHRPMPKGRNKPHSTQDHACQFHENLS